MSKTRINQVDMKKKLLSEKELKEYVILSSERKNTVNSKIIVSDTKKSKPNNYVANTDVHHTTISESLLLTVECNKYEYYKFGFKMLANFFWDKPFVRFESSGTTDRNRFNDIPISEQSVTTPHFHKFDEKGRFIAYKTAKIKSMPPMEVVIEECFVDFCNETNLRHKDSFYPILKTVPDGQIKFDDKEEDPLKNITFVL